MVRTRWIPLPVALALVWALAWAVSAGYVMVAPTWAATNPVPAPQAANQAAIQRGEQLVNELDSLIKQYDQAVKAGADPATLGRLNKQLNGKAFQVSESFHAKLQLKKGTYKGIGARYHDLMKGADGKGGVLKDVLAGAKKKLAQMGYSPDIYRKVQLVQNESSIRAKKAPMDIDAGLLSDPNNPDEARKLLRDLGGPSGEARFRADLQKALEDSYQEVARKKYNVSVDPKRAYVEGTTRWHPEAYVDAEVLKAGGVAQKSLVQQTCDVSKYKVNHFRNQAMAGQIGMGEALTEAARGTYKDLDKVHRVFDEIERLTGVRPKFSSRDYNAISILKAAGDGGLDPFEADRAIRSMTGKGLFESCNELVDRMEEAIRLAPTPRIMKARLYKTYLPKDDLEKAIKSLVSGDNKNLPAVAKALDDQLARVSGVYLVTLEEMTPSQFLDQLKKQVPDLKFKSGDEAVEYILKRLETMPKKSTAVLFGEEASDMIERTRKLLDGGVKKKVARRFLGGGVPLGKADVNTRRYIELGDQKGGVKALAFDGIIGAATALYMTSTIMDQNLPPEEENRQLMNAWVTSLPLVGDLAQSIIDGIEAGFEGDKGKAVRSGIFLTIGVAYCVPGLQIPAVVASLGMMAWQFGGSAWDVYKDKRLIEAWVASGKWDTRTGTLKALYSADKKELPIPPSEEARKQLIELGEMGYHKAQDLNIRESLADYAERTILVGDKGYEASRQAVENLYPDFDLDKALRMPFNASRVAMWTHIKDVGGDRMGNKRLPPGKNLGYALFVKLKRDVYDEALWQAAIRIRKEAEAEYQAQNMVGEAARIFQELDVLADKLKLPLRDHVDAIFESFISWSFAKIKSPWNQHSLPRQHLEIAKRYVRGYTTILDQIKQIAEMFDKVGLKAPDKHHLTGYLDVDAKRMDDLVVAYRGALGTAMKDAKAILTALGKDSDLADTCAKGLFEKLASLRVRMVFLDDRIRLIDQWTGKLSEAEKSRDEALRTAIEKSEKKDAEGRSILYVPLSVWSSLASGYEAAYSWTKVAYDQSGALLGQRDTFAKLYEQRKKDYEKLKTDAAQEVAACLGQVLAKVRYNPPEGGEPLPVSGAQVTLTGGNVNETLTEGKPGDYNTARPVPGTYQVTAKAKGFKSTGGTDEATAVLTVAQPISGQPITPAEVTIFLVPQNKVELKLTFTKASAGVKPKLGISLSSDKDDLDPTGLKLAMDGKEITVTMGGGGKQLTGELEFDQTQDPGKHTVKAKVKDVLGVIHTPEAEFTYHPAIELVGVKVDDSGAQAPDGKATSGETVSILLKLVSHEPSPVAALVLEGPADDQRLKPTGACRWTLGSLPSGQPTETAGTSFKAGQVTPPKEAVRWDLKGTLGGKELAAPLALDVTVWSALALDISLTDILDPKRQGTPNNGDGKAQQGEEIELKFTVTNSATIPSPACVLALSSSTDQLALAMTNINLAPLQPGETKEIVVQAKVGTGYKTAFNAMLTVQPTLQGQAAGKAVQIPIRLDLAPLEIKLVKVTVDDPSSGALVNINDGNGKLGSGEHGFMVITLVNQGADLTEAYIGCSGPNIGGFSVDQAQTGAKVMKKDQPMEARFEVRVPVDWTSPSATLKIKVNDAATGRKWETTYDLAIEAKSDFKSELKLTGANGPAKPEDIAPGAKLGFELKVTCTSANPVQDLVLGLAYTGVSIIPNSWSGQGFAPGAEKKFTGTVTIPPTFNKSAFEIRLDITNSAGTRTVHKNKWAFDIGLKETKVTLTPTAPAAGASDWTIKAEVKTTDGQAVDKGNIMLSASAGQISVTQMILGGSPDTFTWSPPPQMSGQATIKAEYLGDEPDSSKPDVKFKPSSAEVKLPPAAKPTKVKVTAAPVKAGNASRFTITVEVTDDQGRPVNKGALEITCDLGAISGGGIGASGGTVKLTGAPITLSWTAPAAQGQTGKAVFSYTGDQTDPAKPDAELAPSSTTLDLPPDALALPVLTVSKALIDRDKGLWRIEVSLTDDKGRPIDPAKVMFAATGGSFGLGSSVLSAETALSGGKCEKAWIKTDDQQHTVTVTYPGDKSGPGGTNAKYQEVSETLKLPPEMVERSTVFVVDASGSMGGGKLRSAKAAVRAALAGYAPGQGKEEWALIVFAGCGSISVRQPFTTNPNDITSRLGFGAGGGTPIAAAMSKAGRYIRAYGQGKTGRVILLSDGGESCRGDPVKAADSIRRSVRSVTPGGGSNP